MERKLGLLFFMGGLAWSCVSPAEVDEAGTDNEHEAVDSGGSSGTAVSGDTQGSGGTESETATVGGPSNVTATTASAGTGGTGGSTSEVSMGGSGGSASGEQSSGAGGDGAESEDICPLDAELEYDPDGSYPFCEGTEAFILGVGEPIPSGSEPVQNRCRQQMPGSDIGIGISTWESVDGSPDDEPLRYCLCNDTCEVDVDCPSGDSGSATPVCLAHVQGGNCRLSCDDGETCPDGMTCTQGHGIEQRICVWGTRGAGCDTSEWPPVTN